MNMRMICWVAVLLVSLHPTILIASESPMINVNAGRVGVLDESAPWRYGIEYRFSPIGEWQIRPTIGVAQADDDSSFLYLEGKRDFRLSTSWLLTPGFGIGSFDGRRDLRLGHTIEFRSGVELAYRFSGAERIGVAVYHVSNGGISESNPGTEAVVLSLSIPVID